MDILYEDNHLLVVIKPAGILSQEDKTGDMDLLTMGKEYIGTAYNKPGAVYLGLVHRLDRPASGVMVFARTSKAAARLSEQFRERQPRKEYVALVDGLLTGDDVWNDRLQKREGHVHVVKTGGKMARLAWRAIQSRPMGAAGKMVTLLHINLGTGRAHQIRVQSASRGHSIVGDFRYGSRRELDGQNLALHAYRLTIEHPTKREPMTFTAPIPPLWPEWTQRAAHALPMAGR